MYWYLYCGNPREFYLLHFDKMSVTDRNSIGFKDGGFLARKNLSWQKMKSLVIVFLPKMIKLINSLYIPQKCKVRQAIEITFNW